MTKPGMKAKDSIDSLRERMSRDPFSRAFLQLAEEYRKVGRYDEAVKVCMEGLARHPTYHTARIALGRTYLEKGDLESARRALSEVLELTPENHLAAKLLAEVQRRMGDLSGASETYRAILRHYPGDREIAALLHDLQPPKADERPGSAALPPAAPSPAALGVRVESARPTPAGGEPSLDYGPEDLVGGMAGVASPRDAGFRQESRGEGLDAAGPDGPDALQTNTLAELYLRQGLVDRALEVYRAMLRHDPAHEGARRRLRELSGSEPSPPGRRGDGPSPPPMAEPRGDGGGPDHLVPEPAAPRDLRSAEGRDRIARLERWLDIVRSGAAGEAR